MQPCLTTGAGQAGQPQAAVSGQVQGQGSGSPRLHLTLLYAFHTLPQLPQLQGRQALRLPHSQQGQSPGRAVANVGHRPQLYDHPAPSPVAVCS